MPDRSSLRYQAGRFVLGIALLAAAGSGLLYRLGLRDGIGLLPLLLGLYGFRLAVVSAGPMVRILTQDRRLRGQWNETARDAFARASLPRRIFYLLVGVAEVDGPITPAEREAVRHFVLERFADPVQADEVRTWELQPLPITDLVGLAARIGAGLDDTELDSLFCWCCLVAFVDGRFAEPEHLALQQVARGLGISGPRARMLFHLARAQFLRGDRRGEHGGPH
ncbi:MAG: TerB family tellurite resistance protein, partial [Planctomycetota bacterium]